MTENEPPNPQEHDTSNGETEPANNPPLLGSLDIRRRNALKLLGSTAFVGGSLPGFAQPVSGASTSAPTQLLPDDQTKDAVFGIDVALDDDGTTALIASPGNSASYVFEFDSGSWTQTKKFSGVDGDHVALDDTGTVAAVEPNVYTYDGSSWTKDAELESGPVSLDSSGTTALVGTRTGGSVEVFTKSGESWSSTATLTLNDPGTEEQFGWDVALDADGTTGIVSDNFNGPDARGAVYVFESNGGNWSQVAKLQPGQLDSQDNMGGSVAIDDAGETILAGSQEYDDSDQAGAAYAFAKNGGSWSFGQKLTAPDADPIDLFGSDVALGDGGTTALVGEHGDDTKVEEGGAVHVYTFDGSSWSHSDRLAPASPSKDEQLGVGVALDAGTTALGGAFGYEETVDNGGAAYVFDLTATLPSVTLSDLRPIQTVENTVLRNPNDSDSQVDPETPDLVAGRTTSVLFTLTGSENLDELPSGATVDATVHRESSGGSTESDSFELQKSELQSLAQGSTDEAEFFDDAARQNILPVFDLADDVETITVEIDPDIDDDGTPELSGSSKRVRFGVSSIEIQSMDELHVGFIEIADPEGGDNYGDANGHIKDDFDTLVDEAADYLESAYPVDELTRHEHPDRLDDSSALDTSPGSQTEDLKSARSALEDEFPDVDFDVTVAFVPEDFPDFHNDGYYGVHMGGVRAAAAVRGDLRVDIHVDELHTTTAQEVGHHFIDTYPDNLSMRQEDGDIDNTHARTEPDGSNDTPDDKFIDSTGFDLTDGSYELVGHQLESFMSYNFDEYPTWADTHVYDTMLDTELESHPSGSGSSGGRVPILEGIGRLATNDTVTFTRLFETNGVPKPSVTGGAVRVTVLDGDGETLDSRTYPDELEVHRRVPETNRSHSVEEDIVAFAVPFPEETAAVHVERNGTVTRLNPLERSLREAINRLPDAAFTRSPDDRRAALNDKLDAIDEMMSNQKYHPAIRKLRKDVRDKIEKWITDDYETGALQPTKSELLELVDEMIRRLVTVAEESGKKGGSKGGKKGGR